LVLALGACGSDSNANTDAAVHNDAPPKTVLTVTCPGSPAATVTTAELQSSFTPMATTITQGQVVKFVMSASHTVAPNPIAAKTDPGLTVGFGATACLMFTQTGTFGFLCSAHGFVGTVTVQ